MSMKVEGSRNSAGGDAGTSLGCHYAGSATRTTGAGRDMMLVLQVLSHVLAPLPVCAFSRMTATTRYR